MNFRINKSCVLTITVMILSALFVISCTAKIDKSKTMERNGLLYQIGSDEPFTGIVTGISQGEDYRRGKFFFKKEYENGLLQGRAYFYYPDQTIESVEPYDKGVLNGVVTRYHENGQLAARLHFEDGFRGGAKGEMFWKADGSKIKK